MPTLDLIWALNIEAVDTTGIPYVSHMELVPEIPEDDWELDWEEYRNTSRFLAPTVHASAFYTEEGNRVKNTRERLQFEALAKAQYHTRLRKFGPAAETMAIEHKAFDEAVLLQGDGGEQMLLVRSGCVVYSLWENLPADLADWVEPVAAEILTT